MGSTTSTSPLPLLLPPAMHTSPKIVFFTDFDGTITMEDSNAFMADHLGFGVAKRLAGDVEVLEGRQSFRDAFAAMMGSVPTPLNECVDLLLQSIRLDPYFKQFYAWCRANNVPVVVLSGGMRPVIEALLRKLIGDEEAVKGLQIVSNDVGVAEGKKSVDEQDGWRIVFHDDSSFGHDKSIEIRKYSSLPDGQRPIMFYAGDGVSDLSAAKETDLLFAKEGMDLVLYCEKQRVPYTTFADFSSILETVKAVSEGKLDVKDAAKKFESYM